MKEMSVWSKGAVLAGFLALALWTLPKAPADRRGPLVFALRWNDQTIRANSPIRKVLLTTGTWQYWDMFSPDPIRTNRVVWVEIDGATRKLVPPMSRWGPRLGAERYRKLSERMTGSGGFALRQRVAAGLAREFYRDQGRWPQRVRIWMISTPISRPGQEPIPPRQEMLAEWTPRARDNR